MRKLTLDDAKKFAIQKGGECLSDKYTNSHTKMRRKCKNKHKWYAKFGEIKSGKWCPYCAGKAKHTVDDCCKLAQSKGGTFLSNDYKNNYTKYMWKCEKEHTFLSRYNDVDQGHWCPHCKNVARKNIKDCHELAKRKGGRFLSKKFTNIHTKYLWECDKKHTWMAEFNSVNRYSWCPYCNKYGKSSKAEIKLKGILKNIFNNYDILDGYNQFDFLYNKKIHGRQHIDFIVSKNNNVICGIEYDGEQHFKPVRFGGVSEEEARVRFGEQLERDHRKNKIMRDNKNIVPHFIRIKYTIRLTEDNIKKILIKEGILNE